MNNTQSTTASLTSSPRDGSYTTNTSASPAAPTAVGGGSPKSSPRNLSMTEKFRSDWLSGKLASLLPTNSEWLQGPRPDQHDTSPSSCTPVTDRPSPGTSVATNDPPDANSPDILKYVTGRFHAALDHFHDVLFHVLAHVASFHPDAFTIIGRNYQATKNVEALRDLMALQGFTRAGTTPAPVLDEYARVDQLQARVALQLRKAPSELKISELEDCIFLMRKSAADLNAAIARLFTNFCAILERPSVTPGETKCAVKGVRKRAKVPAHKKSTQPGNQVINALANLSYVFTTKN
jgi:hypothetical protein